LPIRLFEKLYSIMGFDNRHWLNRQTIGTLYYKTFYVCN
jgi:hypothetical protein